MCAADSGTAQNLTPEIGVRMEDRNPRMSSGELPTNTRHGHIATNPTSNFSITDDNNPVAVSDNNPVAVSDNNPVAVSDNNPVAVSDNNPVAVSDNNPVAVSDIDSVSDSDQEPEADSDLVEEADSETDKLAFIGPDTRRKERETDSLDTDALDDMN